jgi:2-oxoglutarate dehydrogenase E2 component (dihydrolipoamide succinyltransferase)
MGKVEIVMPKMGESVAEATIIKWLKQEGDRIEADEAVLEIATDKVDSEIPSPESGTLVKQMYKEEDVVKVGDVVAIMEVEGKGASSNGTSAGNTVQSKPASITPEPAKISTIEKPVAAGSTEVKSTSGRFYSPLVRSIAQKEGISQSELDAVQGTGLQHRVTKKDILSYVRSRTGNQATSAPSQEGAQTSSPSQ